MNITNIEWTDFSANPLKYQDAEGNTVWACIHASQGCMRCYSEQLAKRYGRGGPFNVATMEGLTPFLDDKELHHMLTAKTIQGKTVSGGRCFVGDMTDLFGEWVPDDLLNRLFTNVLELRTDVTWQLLTKRAERMKNYLSWRWGGGRIPSRNIWIGVSCEDQAAADTRIPLLLQAPAAIRFVSYEPALGPITFRWRQWDGNFTPGWRERGESANHLDALRKLNWIIYGGESGPGARPNEAAWARSTRDQCQAAGVPFFFKQWGGTNKKLAGRLLDGREWNEFPGKTGEANG